MAVSVSVVANDAGRVGGVSGLKEVYLGTGRFMWPGGAAARTKPSGGPVGMNGRYVLVPPTPLAGRDSLAKPVEARRCGTWKSAGSGNGADVRSEAEGRRAVGGNIKGGAANGVGGGSSSAIGGKPFGGSRWGELSRRALAGAPSPKEEVDGNRRWLYGPGFS